MNNDYTELVEKQRQFYEQGRTKDVSFRLQALESLRLMIKEHETELLDALKKDLNKSPFDSYMTEIGYLLEEIRFMKKHVRKWAKPQKVKGGLAQTGASSFVYPEPYGVTLILAPWNYPFQLAIAPLIGAIAAGNCAVIKPSELTPATSQLIKSLIGITFPEAYVAVVEGDADTSQALLQERFDYIFFTGSVSVGKLVMEAATKHLTPVTLELGGKSPCIVDKEANLEVAAKRIAWGKYLNAGQTCVAPDYLYVHKEVKDQFLPLLKKAISDLYSDDVFTNGSFTRIVSKRHLDRLIGFLENGEVYAGGRYDMEALTLEPTVLTGVSWDDKVMSEEIFGPILPVMEFEDISAMTEQILRHPSPLALYIFTENKSLQDAILEKIPFGGGCINDTIYHLTSPYLPFGGIGESGMGSYHGKGSFDTFTHRKSVLKQTTRFDFPFRYPNRKHALKLIKRLIK